MQYILLIIVVVLLISFGIELVMARKSPERLPNWAPFRKSLIGFFARKAVDKNSQPPKKEGEPESGSGQNAGRQGERRQGGGTQNSGKDGGNRGRREKVKPAAQGRPWWKISFKPTGESPLEVAANFLASWVIVKFLWRLVLRGVVVALVVGIVNRWPLLFAIWEVNETKVISPVWRDMWAKDEPQDSPRKRRLGVYQRYDVTDLIELAIAVGVLIIGFGLVPYVTGMTSYRPTHIMLGGLTCVILLFINGCDEDSVFIEQLFYGVLTVAAGLTIYSSFEAEGSRQAILNTVGLDGWFFVAGGFAVVLFQLAALPIWRYIRERKAEKYVVVSFAELLREADMLQVEDKRDEQDQQADERREVKQMPAVNAPVNGGHASVNGISASADDHDVEDESAGNGELVTAEASQVSSPPTPEFTLDEEDDEVVETRGQRQAFSFDGLTSNNSDDAHPLDSIAHDIKYPSGERLSDQLSDKVRGYDSSLDGTIADMYEQAEPKPNGFNEFIAWVREELQPQRT